MKTQRILFLTPAFSPSQNYFEWVFAKAAAASGHSITVVTPAPDDGSAGCRKLSGDFGEIEVVGLRVKTWRQTRFPLGGRGIVRELAACHDCALLSSPNLGFGYFLMESLDMIPWGAYFGETRDFRSVMSPLVRLIKDNWYKRVFQKATRIICNQPEALDILSEIGLGRAAAKARIVGLPVDGSVFRYDESIRRSGSGRRLITVTRLDASVAKPVDVWFSAVVPFLRDRPEWSYTVAGAGEGKASEELRRLVASSGLADRIHLLPVLGPADIVAEYHQADLALFFRPTIGIQQALATGLPCVIPDLRSVSHLIEPGLSGEFFRGIGALPDALEKAGRIDQTCRALRARAALRFTGRIAVDQILNLLLEDGCRA